MGADGTGRAEFATFYRAHWPALVGFFVRRIEDRELARDLTAEAFRVAWTRWDAGEHPNRAWLFGVARNLVGDEWRRRARSGPIDELPDTLPATDRHRDADVRLVLGALAPAEREVLVLTYWDGLSAAEVAEVLATTRANIWTRLHRARKAFAEAWRDSPPAADIGAARRIRPRPAEEAS